MSTMRTLLLFVLAVSSCVLQSVWSQEPSTNECYNGIGEPTRCVPITQSFSLGQLPTVNSTCGTPPNEFCLRRLTIRGVESDCSQICDASDPANAHPPNLMTDFLLVQESWWQSENNQEIVVIDLSLQTMVEITVIAFGFVSFKPDAFYIQKSTDYGSTYTPFHFFSTSCIDKYMIDPELNLEIDNETTVLCQPIDVPPDPGQISFFPALGRPSANDTTPGLSEELYTFVTATDIRVVLDGFFVIDGLPAEDPGDYFYAIEDLNVVGRCQCNGHAPSCNINPDSAMYQCDCQHNTAGTFCEQCRDFYQDVPWQIADGREPFECKPCNCHEHSTECIFNPTIYAATGSVSGGECLNCANNTAGRQCETCIEFYYPRPDRNQTDPDVCTICGCDIRGVIDDGDCAREASEELDLGDCSCKENAVGRTCSQCKAGFFNLTSGNPDGCQACGCNETGSIDATCHQATGVCNCKPNIVGEKCDFCEQGFYNSDPNGQQGCQPCDCNIGGAFSNQCDVFTGQCACRQGVTGRTCSMPIANHFFPAIDYLMLEGEEAGDIANHELRTTGSGIVFTGTGYYRVTEGSAMVNFGDITPPKSGQYEILFRYNLEGILTFDDVTLIIRAGSEDGMGAAVCRNGSELPVGDSTFQYTSWPLGIGIPISQVFCLRGGRKYTFIIQEFSSGQTGEDITFLIDSLVAMPIDIPGLQVLSDITLSEEYSNCVDQWRSVLTQTSARPGCEDITFALSTELYNGTLPCDCDALGSEGTCDSFGGKCTCRAGITGRRCDQCEPGTYNSSGVGCSACNCSVEGSASSVCDPASGLCSCLENVVGRDCSSCAADHWGLEAGMGCAACQCNATGSVSLQCDQTTGMCTCRPGVTGSTCDQCMELHYGFSDTGCSPCGCSPAGTTNSSCDITTGQCTCLSNTEGRDCSQCIQSTFNLQASNPFGCQPCFCSGQSTSCVSAGGYVAGVVLTEFNASDIDPLQGWTSTSSSSPEPGSAIAIMPFSDGITILANSDSYLEAPSQYLGNKLSSYAQFIQITLEPTGASAQTLSVHDVILSGNGLQLGVSFQPLNGIEPIAVRIHLHEASGIWVNIQTNQSATAYELQLVLSHLDELLVTASYNVDIILYNISLDVAIQDSSDGSISWVEMCSCPANYTGLSCEQCASSYTRNPSGTCELCQCNGLSTTCDSETGECTNCTNMTTGASCEQCTRGTYGDPKQGIPCQPCPCPLPSGVGQFTDECSLLDPPDDVECLNCPEGHMGRQCEECAPGFFGDPLGNGGTPTMCSDCLCNGNTDPRLPDSCDTMTGICLACLNNTAGDHCETCADGYYGDAITTKNCTECGCSTIGSNSTLCDHTTGQCLCLPNVEGQQCSQCAPNHYGLSSGRGCASCDCHPEGAESSQCDLETGQCSCRLGVTGRTCNQCLLGYFGLSSQGCQMCTCSQVNSISDTCDANNGDCICTAGATGTGCQECIENYFQTDQGCSECPECYQELQSEVNITMHLLETTDARIANLSTMVSPFDSRLNQTQNQVLSAVVDVQELSNEHERLNTLFTDLSNSIQSLSTQLVELDTSLKILQSSSTPVFVLAQTAEELMNRTIQELNLAQDVVDEIATDILPAIQNSADSIQNSSMVGRMTANELDEYVATLSSQVDLLLNITNSIALITTTAILGAEELISLHADNQRAVSDLQQSQTSAQEALSFLMTELYTLTSAIASTTNQIHLEFEDLAVVPSEAGLNDLLTNSSNTEGYANSLAGEVSHQDSRLSELTRNLNESRLKVDSILQQVSNLGENVSNLGSDSDDAHQRTSDTVSTTEEVIEEAEMILNNLQNFSIDSFDIGEITTETLQLVRMINISAADALTTARNIEETVERSMQDIATAKAIAIQAQNISFRLVQDSTVDTSSLVANVSKAINSSLMSLDSIESSSVEASGSLFSLEQQTTEVDQAEMQVAIGSNLTINSGMLSSELKTSVNGLQDALQSIVKVDPAKLNNIIDLIQDADNMTTSVDIAALYQSLNASLVAQQQRRYNLEQELASLEEEVAYFRHIMSILPEDCDSNL